MRFLVDGYNVTRSDVATRELDLEAQRLALVRRLAARGSAMLGAGPITVVFDGSTGLASRDERVGNVDVRYARGCSADDAIVAIAEGSGERVVLVTSDRGLATRVSGMVAAGLEVRPSSVCFEAAGRGSERREPRPAPRRDVGLPAGGNMITRELKDTWDLSEGVTLGEGGE